MKKLLLSAVLVFGSLVSGSALAKDQVYIDSVLQKVCKAVQSNSKGQLHRTLKAHRLSYKAVSEKVKCNGRDVLAFASLEGADKSARLIAKRANKALPEAVARR